MTTLTSDSATADGGDLRSLLAMLRRRAWVIVLAVVVGVAASLVFSALQPKRYQSTAKLLFRPTLIDFAVSGVTLQNPNQDQQRQADTNLGLLSLDAVRQRAAAQLGPDYTPARIKKDVKFKSDGQTDLVSVKASASNAEQAARLANAVAASFVAYQRTSQRSQVVAAIRAVRANLRQKGLATATRTGLKASLERLNLLAAVQNGGVSVVQQAEPPNNTSSPKPVLNGILGGAIGLLIGLGLTLASEQLDRRVRRVDQLEDALGLPVLANVPRNKVFRRKGGFTRDAAAVTEEPFQRLRTSLRYVDGPTERRSVLVTSAREGSGKTTVATHLAAALAQGGQVKVLLIEADLRRPLLARLLNLPSDRGLSRLLTDADPHDVSDHIFRIPLAGTNGSGPAGPEVPGFDALPGGPLPEDPSSLLDSGAMRDLLLGAQSRYDIVVIEAPPPTLLSDGIPLMKQADGVLIVGRLGRESEPQLRELRDELERFGVMPVGIVANFSTRPNPYYAKR